MKDIHTHILPGIDDGAEDIEESIEILESAILNGYTDIILTPHYRLDQGYVCDNDDKFKLFDALKRECKARGLDINLYLGNEITIDDRTIESLEGDLATTLNQTRYILLELPFEGKYNNLDMLINKLQKLNCKIIIAHPERYEDYSIKEYKELIKKGVYFQGNISSLYGKYGKKSKKVLESMIKHHMIHFMGSDIHHSNQTSFSRVRDAITRINKLSKTDNMGYELVDTNIEKVIRNQDVLIYKVK